MPAPAAWPTAGTPLGVSRKDDELARQPFRLHLAARGCPKRRVAIGTIAGSPPQGLPPAAWQAPRKGRRRLLQPEPPLPGVSQKGEKASSNLSFNFTPIFSDHSYIK